jgi:enoyl-CoA hydratase/carnithine racemase
VIAKIRGHCFTGGLELALGCDLLLASESAQLGDTHGQWGLVPIWGMTVRLPERIGRARAKELMFTSRRIPAAEAAAIGLIDRVVPETELDDAVHELAQEVTRNSWGTNRIGKLLLRAGAERTRSEALLHERSAPYGFPEDMRERLRARPAKKRG